MAVPQIVEDHRSPVEQFIDQVLDKDRLDAIAREMPSHVKPDLFKRNVLNAVMANPKLMKYSPGLLFREVSKAAGLGLLLDPQLGEAYIVESYSAQEPQLRIGYRGVIKLARQSGEIGEVYAHEVRQSDHIDCDLGAVKKLVHRPDLFSDRGNVIGYYAVMKFRDGAFDFEPMGIQDIIRIRDRTDAYKAFVAKRIKSTPWDSDFDEMAKKTVIRRLMKRAPQSPELAEALRIEDRADGYLASERERPRLVPPKPPVREVIEQKPSVEAPAAEPQAAAPANPPKPPVPPKPPQRKQETQDDGPPTFAIILAKFEKAAAAAKDMDELNTHWAEIVEPHEDSLLPPDHEELLGVFRRRERDFEP